MTVGTLVEHRLGPVDQIPVGEGREFQIGGLRVAVVRPRPGGLAAPGAECPHRGGPLADGMVGMDTVVCPLHGWRFSLVSGAARVGDCDLRVYPVRLDESGDILVSLPSPVPRPRRRRSQSLNEPAIGHFP